MNKRKHSFDQYHANRVDDREKRVKKTLKLIKHGTFTALTPLAKQVTDIINSQYELEAEYKTDENIKPKKMHYTSLIRKGSSHRKMLLAYLAEDVEETSDNFEKMYHDLLVHCASVENENELLRNRLDHLGDENRSDGSSGASTGENRLEDLRLLIQVIDAMKNIAPELSYVVNEDEVTEDKPVPGLYGVRGLVLGMEELHRLGELRRECE